MSQLVEVRVPDIGDFKDVPIIEILVKPGDSIAVEAPLITLESEKATLDVPSPVAGVVSAVKVKVGDKVAQGTLVVRLIIRRGAFPTCTTSATCWSPAALPTR